MRFLGLWLITAHFPEASQSSFFKPSQSVAIWDNESPVKLDHTMSLTRFDEIADPLRFARGIPPAHRGRFFKARELIANFNEHAKNAFIPS